MSFLPMNWLNLYTADMLSRVFAAHDLQQMAYLPLLVAHQPAGQGSSAELSMSDSGNQLIFDLAEFLQLDSSPSLYAE